MRKTFLGAMISYCGTDMFGPILVTEGSKKMKRYGCLFTRFQAEQFILNLQIYYLMMPSCKHFKDLYQEEVIFELSKLKMAQTLLG